MKNTIRPTLKALAATLIVIGSAANAQDPWAAARENGEAARRSFLFCWRFTLGWLQHADSETGLIPRNLGKDAYWNARDCAADNYPFMVLSSRFTSRRLFEGPMRGILATEQRLCNRVGPLPDDWVFATDRFRTDEPDMDAIVFGASEYVKDGLMPLTEWMGPSPWADRLIELVDGVLAHAAVETPAGTVPSTSHEVAGELMQSLSRLYWMTGETRYRDAAYRMAEYFFEHDSPIAHNKLSLDDHGCEVIGGLSEVYLIASREDPAKHGRWKPAMHALLDRVLEVGRGPHGLLYMAIDPIEGKVLNEERTDNWGYDYNAHATVAIVDGVERYHEAVRTALKGLPHYNDYPWEKRSAYPEGLADGLADSLEGGINLMNRYPCAEAAAWADHTAARLLERQRDTGIIEGWHGDGNSARTLIMYALWKSRGAYVEPWRPDLRVGAAVDQEGWTCFVIESDWPWQGTLRFDVPRHREYFHLPMDYPRLNQFPEWFTVGEDDRIEGEEGLIDTAVLRTGLEVKAGSGDDAFRLRLRKLAKE